MLTNTGAKTSSCSQCSFSCSRAVNLKTHIQIHTGAGTWHLNFQVPGALCKVTGKVDKWGIPGKGSQNAVQKCIFQVASALQSKVMAQT